MNQFGGTKIVIKDADGTPKLVYKLENETLIDIFKHIVSVEAYYDSVCSVILKITIPEEITPFRSDVFDETGELLNASNYMDPTTGKKLTQHILKCLVIQEDNTPRIKYKIRRQNKVCVFSEEFHEEFDAQAHIYKSTIASGGSPVCPDVSAWMTLSFDEFKQIFTTIPEFILNALTGIPAPAVNIGIILMEAIPDIYDNLGNLYDEMGKNIHMNRLFTELSKQCLAIIAIIVYRAGIFPLDAHLNNWMYITDENWNAIHEVDQLRLKLFRVKAIDFDLILFRNNLEKIKTITQNYFEYLPESIKRLQITQFAKLMDVDNPERISTSEQAGSIMRDKINNLNHLISRNQDGRVFFSNANEDLDSYQHIHSILVLSALLDAFFNTNMSITKGKFFKDAKVFQMRFLYRALFGSNFNTISTILDNVNVNIHEYYKSSSADEIRRNISIYQDIQRCINEHLYSETRGVFPHSLEAVSEVVHDPWKFWEKRYPTMPILKSIHGSGKTRKTKKSRKTRKRMRHTNHKNKQ
jgi:hypothetical protein